MWLGLTEFVISSSCGQTSVASFLSLSWTSGLRARSVKAKHKACADVSTNKENIITCIEFIERCTNRDPRVGRPGMKEVFQRISLRC